MTGCTVVLVGTSHIYQTAEERCPLQNAQDFQHFLSEACRQYDIRTVAEEMNAEALAEVGRNESTPQRVANKLSLTHLFCDPDRGERNRLGLLQENDVKIQAFFGRISNDEIARRIRDEYGKREHYWLERLRTVKHWPVLFICGANHVMSFEAILEADGFSVRRIADDWAPTS